jgi:hypothetical protein
MAKSSRRTEKKVINLSRSDVIAALYTEPRGAISPGWIYGDPADPACKVCAVGAVIRYVGKHNKTAKGIMALNGDRFSEVCGYNARIAGQPLQQLSDEYEYYTGSGMALGTIRKQLAKFVLTEFPAKIKIEVQV